MKGNRFGKILVFGVFSCFMGAFAGTIVRLVLYLMGLGIYFLWTVLPGKLGFLSGEGDIAYLGYSLAVCIAGGVIIGLWQRRYGLLPQELPEVMGELKKNGTYPYSKMHILGISALLPLVFGGALGPEAGMTGLIVALCCFMGDRLKCKGDEVAALAEAGFAATLGVVFNAPLFGIVNNVEANIKADKENTKEPRKRLVKKTVRVFLYIMAVLGGMLAMRGLGKMFGSGGGIPRFDAEHAIGIQQWKWFVLIIIVGIVAGFFYLAINKITFKIGQKLLEKRILSCVIAGIILAVVSFFIPYTMFSGEHEMGVLRDTWQTLPALTLVLVGFGKLFMISTCINLGWRGGNVFPIIFSGVALGFAAAEITGMDGGLAVALMCSTVYGYIMRQPLVVIAILFLCFPITYIVPLAIGAFVASKVPVPKMLQVAE